MSHTEGILSTPTSTGLFNEGEKRMMEFPALFSTLEDRGFRVSDQPPLPLQISRLTAPLALGRVENRVPLLRQLRDLGSGLYPQNYKLITKHIEDQREIFSERNSSLNIQNPYDILKAEFESEMFDAPENIRAHLSFGMHSVINERERILVQDKIKQGARTVFRQGEKNVAVIEFMGFKQKDIEVMNSLIRRHKSFVNASIVYVALTTGLPVPTQEQFKKVAQSISPDDIFNFRIAELDVFDQLRKEFPIELMLEMPQVEGSEYDPIGDRKKFKEVPVTIDRFKHYLRRFTQGALVDRNKKYVTQLERLADESKDTGMKTNVFAFIGAAHEGIIDLLPPRLRNIVSNETESNGNPTVAHEIISRMSTNKAIPSDLWELAFRQYKATGILPD